MLHDIAAQLMDWLAGLGYWGIVIGLAIEVIPSEAVLAYGGYLASHAGGSRITFIGAIAAGTAGALVQQWILYAVGRCGGRPFLDRYGKWIKIKPKHMDIAERWFGKYGSMIVFTARFVPVMRQVISIPAGIARMNIWLFSGLTLLASIPWSILFVTLGYRFGSNMETISAKAAPYVQPAVLIAIAAVIVYLIAKRTSAGRTTV